MTKVDTIRQLLQRMSAITDWKYALGLHIRFANPTLLYQTYPQEWIDRYASEGMFFSDPVVRWAIDHTGICDWSDLAPQDANNVLGQAADYGLKFGKVVSIGQQTKSFGFFAHGERPITTDEIAAAEAVFLELHDTTQGTDQMSETELLDLRDLNLTLGTHRSDH